ncbi:hypothetical protein BGX21_005883 [Mortierella sp. AD011]|nr:hypothetical protein BGX20_004368 [Mortierella sp. AD010]KAF9399634.1 hypothetical protein BGX21_005883 [Mortierella sp. AD011]
MKNAQSEPRPKQVNIHVLETAVIQYPADCHHIHSNSGTCQFVLLCRTGSGSIDNYGASNDFSGRTNSRQHHSDHEHDHDLQCDYRSLDIISNLYFKTDSLSAESSGVSGTPSVRSLSPLQVSSTSRLHHKQQAASNAESQLPEGDSNANILISQLSSSSPQATDSSRAPNPELRYVPCPYRPISNSSPDHENNPPPSRMNTETSNFGERNHLSKSEDVKQQQSNHHHLDHQFKQTSSSASKKRHFGTSSNWSMSIQTYYDQHAATNAMILAARQYMESREAEECKLVQRTDTTRIIWNNSTKQKLIWSITSTYMDSENPGELVERDYYPSRWEQKEQQL